MYRKSSGDDKFPSFLFFSQRSRTLASLLGAQRAGWNRRPEIHNRDAVDIDWIIPRNPSPYLPPYPPIRFDTDRQFARALITAHFITERGSDGNRSPHEGGGQEIGVLVPLIKGWKRIVKGYLLAFVGDINPEAIVVDTDLGVRVCRDEGDLEGGVDELRIGGEVELVDLGLLEGEAGLGGMEEEVDEEDEGEEGGEESGQGKEELLVELGFV